MNQELQAWKDAMWDYVLEHSDLTERGSFFVKFHTKTRAQFEGHVSARMKGYHRRDARSNFTNEQKERDAHARRTAHESRKAVVAERKRARKAQMLSLKEQRRAIAEMHESVVHRWVRKVVRTVIRTGIIVKSVVMRTAGTDSDSPRGEGTESRGRGT